MLTARATITIEAETTTACEDALLAAAADIRERRDLVSQGCVCDLSAPKLRPAPTSKHWIIPNRCHGDVTVCLPRRRLLGRTAEREGGACNAPLVDGPAVVMDHASGRPAVAMLAHGDIAEVAPIALDIGTQKDITPAWGPEHGSLGVALLAAQSRDAA